MPADDNLNGYQGSYQGYGDDPFDRYDTDYSTTSEPPPEKKKSRRDVLDGMFTYVNYNLLVAKTFYFFFFAAFGSLFPLIAVYFKQIGMNPSQCGMLVGIRPFVEFVSSPFWGTLADRWKKGKQMLLFALFCWVAFTLTMAFIKPKPEFCIARNTTTVWLVEPYKEEAMKLGALEIYGRKRRDVSESYQLSFGETDPFDFVDDDIHSRAKREADPESKEKKLKDQGDYSLSKKVYYVHGMLPHPRIIAIGKSPLPLNHEGIAEMGPEDVKGLVSPPFSNIVYKSNDIYRTFLLILLVVIIGEFFSAPAIALADAATLGYLQDDVENYGRQRMFGSLGWGLSMFFVGIALDQSDVFANHPCGYRQMVERNYTVCFAVFAVLMSCAFLASTQFKFHYDTEKANKETITLAGLKSLTSKVVNGVRSKITGQPPPQQDPQLQGGNYQGEPERKLEITLSPDAENAKPRDMVGDVSRSNSIHQDGHEVVTKPSPYVPRGMPGQSGSMPHWLTVLKSFASVRYGAMLYLTWFMGFGTGLVFTFLFWHLQDLGGTPTLFGIASVINHISEIVAYFFSKMLIQKVGHVRVLYLGLAGNVARFVYISYLRNPWWVLPFEFLQGLTHAAVWAALCSYITQATRSENRATAQGLLQGMHHGLGRGCGAVIGGLLIYRFGSDNVFRGYGIACCIVLGAYIALNYFYISKLPQDTAFEEEPKEFMEESSHLAPCGVPMSLSRNLSSSKLDEAGGEGPKGGQTRNGFLDPGGNNANSQAGQFQPPSHYGGGGSGDGGYGYNKDDSAAFTALKNRYISLHKVQGMARDYDLIKSNLQSQDESYHIDNPPMTQAIVLKSTPRPQTTMHLQQPPNACIPAY